MRHVFTCACVAGLLSLRLGHAASAPTVQFLGADPIGPLAQVVDGAVRPPARNACQRWAQVGSRWQELDELGAIAGEIEVASREYYDYTRCYELRVHRVSGHAGAGVYVDPRGGYHAPAVVRWQPSPPAQSALERLEGKRQRGITNLDPSQKVSFAARTLFFDWGPRHEHYAVVGGLSLLVCMWRDQRWVVVSETKPPKHEAIERAYRPLIVTDMNGDGLPEIVFHFLEDMGEWYGDWTLSLRPNGTWVEVRAGIFGSTA